MNLYRFGHVGRTRISIDVCVAVNIIRLVVKQHQFWTFGSYKWIMSSVLNMKLIYACRQNMEDVSALFDSHYVLLGVIQ